MDIFLLHKNLLVQIIVTLWKVLHILTFVLQTTYAQIFLVFETCTFDIIRECSHVYKRTLLVIKMG